MKEKRGLIRKIKNGVKRNNFNCISCNNSGFINISSGCNRIKRGR